VRNPVKLSGRSGLDLSGSNKILFIHYISGVLVSDALSCWSIGE
jgi:hypothetical protein